MLDWKIILYMVSHIFCAGWVAYRKCPISDIAYGGCLFFGPLAALLELFIMSIDWMNRRYK